MKLKVENRKPLSLNDLETVASFIGVPPSLLGVEVFSEDAFSEDAWNNFINSTIMPILKEIEAERKHRNR